MIQLTIIFKNSNITLPLNFKAYGKAEEISRVAHNGGKIQDDYGTVAELDGADISGVVLVDLNRELDRQAQYSVMQALSQKKAQESFQELAGSKILKPINTLANSVN